MAITRTNQTILSGHHLGDHRLGLLGHPSSPLDVQQSVRRRSRPTLHARSGVKPRAGPDHTTRCRRSMQQCPFPGLSQRRNNDRSIRIRSGGSSPRIMGEVEKPEWHDQSRDTPGKKVEPGSQRKDCSEVPRDGVRSETWHQGRSVSPEAGREGDRSEDRRRGTRNLRTNDPILICVPDQDADCSGSVLEDG